MFVWTTVVATTKLADMAHQKSTAAGKRFDSLEQQAYLNLWRTYDRLRMFEDELFDRFDLTAQQYNVLRLLRGEYPGAVPTLALATRLVSRAPDITRILDKLECRRLIVRERPADNRRRVLVTLAAAGRELLEQLDQPVRDCHTRQLGHLSRLRLRQLIELLALARAPHEPPQSPWTSSRYTD